MSDGRKQVRINPQVEVTARRRRLAKHRAFLFVSLLLGVFSAQLVPQDILTESAVLPEARFDAITISHAISAIVVAALLLAFFERKGSLGGKTVNTWRLCQKAFLVGYLGMDVIKDLL